MKSIINKLKEHNIKINVLNDNLKLDVPEEFENYELLEEIREYKHELISFIKKINGVSDFSLIEKCKEKESYVMSSAQKRLYFLYEFDPFSVAYNMPQVVRLKGKVDKTRLAKAFKQLIIRHESFRTSFDVVEGKYIQKISDERPFELAYYQAKEEETQDIIDEFIKPFDLRQSPLIRVGLLSFSERSHLLMVDMHHIITDGVSQGILINDFKALYDGKELPALKLQYKDYAEWQQSEDRREQIAKQKGFWMDLYAAPPQTLDLPTDFSRPLVSDNLGGWESFEISKELTTQLKKVAGETGVTLYMVLLSAYAILLAKLGDQEDIVIGTPTAGREHSDLEAMVGMFVNTLPLRYQVDGTLGFSEFLKELSKKTIACFDNQSYPYEDLVEDLKIGRDASRNPLFDVMFSYDNFEDPALELSEITLEPYESDQQISKFDLSLSVHDNGDKLHLVFEYASCLFRAETIRRFAGYFKKIVASICDDRNIELFDIDIVSDKEKEQLLKGFNLPELDHAHGGTVIDLIEEQTQLHASRKAISFKEGFLTYRELNKKVNQLSHYLLTSKKVQTGDKIGLYLERSPSMIIALLAILKSGATYVPLDPDYPADRVKTIINNAGLTHIVTDLSDDLHHFAATVGVVDVMTEKSLIDQMPTTNPSVAVKSDHAAYVIYTSGSTGLPKGVIIAHSSLLDYSFTFKKYFSLTKEDKVIQQSSLSFDTAVEEIFPALLSGASIVVMPHGGRDIEGLVETIKTTEASILSTTPVVLNALNDHADRLKSLRVAISGGDVLFPEYIDKLFGQCNVYNTYGPSESTVCITYHKIEDLENASCIGKPIENRQVYIVDQIGKLCPIGVPGELCVSGKGLSLGYLGDDLLTQKKFVKNSIVPGQEMYRTGDLAKWLPDGNIEFLGRADDQVKIRGVRIELKEIESHLLSHQGIKEAVVVTQGQETNKHLVAYYVSDVSMNAPELRGYLTERLPNHMVPAHFVHLTTIPMVANGSKPDKKALSAPTTSNEEYYVPASSETEKKLSAIWSDILKVDKNKISVTSSFFELGGHSLRATVLVNKIHKEFSVNVPLREIFKYQDIRSLGSHIDSSVKSAYTAIKNADEKEYYVLSSVQRRLYFLYEFDKQSLAYNMPSVVKIEGELDKVRLEETFGKLIDRHESLRTSFIVVNDEPVQQIHPGHAFEIEYFRSTAEEVPDLINNFVRPFDLSKGPLIRVGLIEKTSIHPREHILMVDMHHIITDGVSQGILIKDFMMLYQGNLLPNLKLQYKDYAEWQQDVGQQEEKAKEKAFWLETFAETPTVLELPTDFARLAAPDHTGSSFDFKLGKEESQKLKALAKAEGATLFMVLLSVYNILLAKLGNQEDIVVGTPIAGRQHDDLEDVIGMFVNTLALRNHPKGSLSYKTFLSTLKKQTLFSFEHQAYPYEELVEELKIERDTSRNPLFDAMFTFQNLEESALGLPGLKLKPYDSGHQVSKFDITLSAGDDGEQLYLIFEYATYLFKKETIKKFAAYFQQIVSSIVKNEDVKISDINILSEAEQAQLLEGFNNTARDYPRKATLVSLFEQQVESTPRSLALVYHDTQLNYQTVNEKANQLAHYIKGRGVKQGAIVGIMLDRSVEMVTGILAILKAGAVYMPLDPSNPEDRNAGIIQESRAVALLTTGANKEVFSKYTDVINVYEQAIYAESVQNPGILRSSDDVAYVLYTSGSTGKPKGVVVRHQSVVNLVYSQKELFGVNSQERILQFSTITFDASVEQVWLALLSGASLVLLDKAILADNTSFDAYISSHQVTHLHATPSFLESIEINTPNSLKRVVSGGEECRVQTAQKYCKAYGFYNKYGLTETTVTSTIKQVHERDTSRISIGKPINNTVAYILGNNRELLPIGVKRGIIHRRGRHSGRLLT